MAALRNPKHEKVAQELAALRTAEEASAAAGYDARASSFASNARKRAQRKDIQARVAEIQGPAAERAGITAEYLLAKLDNLTEYNIDDYLTARDESGQRFLDVGAASRAVLARLSELNQDVSIGDDGRRLMKTKIKGYDVIGAIRLMAQIKGLLAPEKIAPTTPDGKAPFEHVFRWKTPADGLLSRS